MGRSGDGKRNILLGWRKQKFKNILRTFWGLFVIKHPINKKSISLTPEIVCSYMRVFTVVVLEL